MRETDCQEVKQPRDGDHGEGMDSMGLGMACEDSRGGGEMENICSVYLLRSRIHDHNPAAVPEALSAPPLQRVTLCAPFPSFRLDLSISFCVVTNGGSGRLCKIKVCKVYTHSETLNGPRWNLIQMKMCILMNSLDANLFVSR